MILEGECAKLLGACDERIAELEQKLQDKHNYAVGLKNEMRSCADELESFLPLNGYIRSWAAKEDIVNIIKRLRGESQ